MRRSLIALVLIVVAHGLVPAAASAQPLADAGAAEVVEIGGVDAGGAAADGGVPAAVPDGGVLDVGDVGDAGVAPLAVDAAVAPPDAAPPPETAGPLTDTGPIVETAPLIEPGPLTDTATITPGEEPPTSVIEPPAPRPEKSAEDRAIVFIKLIAGLVALMVLAYLGGHRRVVRLQERLGIGGVIAAGFPFVALGLIARQPEVGILTEQVVARLQPLLHFGLGWLGFIIGAQLDIRVLDRVPQGTAYLIVVEALAPFAVTASAVGAVMITIGGAELDDPTFWRDIIVLGTAAAMTAPRRFRGFANRTWREGRGVDHLLAQLDEIVGVIGLLFVAAYFRPEVTTGWQLPGTAWVFVSLGLGVVIGILIFAMVRVPVSNAEFLAVVIGSIAFGAGLAGYLYLSPIVICFLAGALVTNFPCQQRESIFRILNHLERPIHLLFLIIVGATWDVFDWRGWIVVPLFVAARVIGKWLGIFAAKQTVGRDLPQGYADQRALVTPVSALAIALVISVHGLGGTGLGITDGGGASMWITTVVIGGAVLTELLVSITSPSKPRPRTIEPIVAVTPPPIDELDEPEEPTDVPTDHEVGPVYVEDDELPPMVPRDPTLPPSKLKKP